MNRADKVLTVVGIVVFSTYVYVHIAYPKECASALQSMREEANPEYYILQEMRSK